MKLTIATANRLLDEKKLRELLHIPEGLKGADLEKACRKARVLYHPDRGGDPQLASLVGAAVDELLKQAHVTQAVYAS